jgi:nucleoside 2-deoxyribosyltransferase
MDSGNPTCYLSFPDDATSVVASARLRAALEERGIDVLPPPIDPETASSISMRPFHWLRQSDLVVVDITGDSSWVAYEAGAALALNKRVILIAQNADSTSPIEAEIARSFLYETGRVDDLADLVRERGLRAER